MQYKQQTQDTECLGRDLGVVILSTKPITVSLVSFPDNKSFPLLLF